MEVDGKRAAPAALPPGKTLYPLYRWAPGTVWMGAEISPPPGFNPRTFQSGASRYTDWAMPAYSYTSNAQ